MILVTGATGFVGRHVVARLAERGEPIRCLVRSTSPISVLTPYDVELCQGDVAQRETLAPAMAGVNTVVHLVAVIREKGSATFEQVNHMGTANLVAAAAAAGVERMVHLSANGARSLPDYRYLYSKWQGEEEVKNSGLIYTVLRPSIIFGPEDQFTNRLAGVIRLFPVVPILGSGKVKLQPIWVDDVARCVALCLEDGLMVNRTFSIGGPEQLTYGEIVDLVIAALGANRLKANLPLALVWPLAWLMERLLPNPLITTLELDMLGEDNIVNPDAVARHFGFEPLSLREGLGYLRRTT